MDIRQRVGRLSDSPGARAFHHRNYRLFFAGQLISLIGTGMQMIAQGWLVLSLTGSPLLLGVVSAAQFLPVLVLGLFGGLVADVWPKRRTLVATQSVMMALAIALWVLTASQVVTFWMILGVALCLGAANAVDMPVRQSFVVELVGRQDVANAVALNSAMFNSARIIGPAVAGVTIGIAGEATAFLLNGLSFLAAIASLLLMRDDELRSQPRATRPRSFREVGGDLHGGLRHAVESPAVLLAIIVVGVVSTFGLNFAVTVPAYADSIAHAGAEGYGFLMAASGVGALAAALVVALRGRTSVGAVAGGALLLGAGEVAISTTDVFALAAVLMFLCGAGSIVMQTAANTLVQVAVPDALRGRVAGIYMTVHVGSSAVGGPLIGAVAMAGGAALAFAVGGGACALTGLLAGAWLRSHPAVRDVIAVASRPEADVVDIAGARS